MHGALARMTDMNTRNGVVVGLILLAGVIAWQSVSPPGREGGGGTESTNTDLSAGTSLSGIMLYTTEKGCTGEVFIAAVDESDGEERIPDEVYLGADGISYAPLEDSRTERTVLSRYDGACHDLEAPLSLDSLDVLILGEGIGEEDLPTGEE